MPELDGIRPNPKRPVRKVRATGQPLPPDQATRRRRVMWGIVGIATALILLSWYALVGSQLGSTSGDNTAWEILKRKVSDLTSVFNRSTGDQRIKDIDVNAPTPEQIQYLREQVFPDAAASSNTAVQAPSNQNVNGS